jgi:FKBP-type peptidyl-prolyl cis-trans isomerase (trigger factor)
MCSREEVREIVESSEARMESRIEELAEREQRLRESQLALAVTISELNADFKKFYNKFEHIEAEDLKLIVSSYNGITTFKNMVTGLASIIIAISAIGAAVIWIVRSIR